MPLYLLRSHFGSSQLLASFLGLVALAAFGLHLRFNSLLACQLELVNTMIWGMLRDGINICLWLGMKPLNGMAIPGMFTFTMLWGVWYNNVRREMLCPAFNKMEGMDGPEGGH